MMLRFFIFHFSFFISPKMRIFASIRIAGPRAASEQDAFFVDDAWHHHRRRSGHRRSVSLTTGATKQVEDQGFQSG
jgi:hypothetical protein